MDLERIMTAFGTVIVLVIGWALNQWSGISKIRRENRTRMKIVLFNLLEVHFLIARLDARKVADRLSGIIYERLIPEDGRSDLLKKMLFEQYLVLVRDKLFPHLTTRLPVVKEGYEKSIDEIKGILPLIAFRLSGKTEIIDYLDNLEEIVGIKDMSGSERQVNSNLMNELSPFLKNELLDSFEKDILSLAFRISTYTWWKTKRSLTSNRDLTQFDKSLSDMVEQMKPIIESTQLSDVEQEAFINRYNSGAEELFPPVNFDIAETKEDDGLDLNEPIKENKKEG